VIKISKNLSVDESEIEYQFIRSPGPGGQNVNKVATGVVLRFNVKSLPALSPLIRERLGKLAGSRISSSGDLIIKATHYRTQNRNKQDALKRLCHLLELAATPPKKRYKTKPTKASIRRRLETKKIQAKTKSLRRKPSE